MQTPRFERMSTVLSALLLLLAMMSSPLYAQEEQKKEGYLVIKTNAKDAELRIDGEICTFTPTITLAPGTHTVSLAKHFYQTREEAVTIESGKSKEIKMELQENGKKITIKTQEPGTQIYVDGIFKAIGECVMDVNYSQQYSIQGRRDGFKDTTDPPITFTAASKSEYTIGKLKPIQGKLRLFVTPIEAIVKVDNRRIYKDKNDCFSEDHLSTGTHVVSISHPDYEKFSDVIVEIEEGLVTERTFELTRAQTGKIAIRTDPDVAIYHVYKEGEDKIYLGSTNSETDIVQTVLPVGENVLMLKGATGATYTTTVYVNLGDNPVAVRPFMRTIKVIAPSGSVVEAVPYGSSGQTINLRANRTQTLDPIDYTIKVTKKNSFPYSESVYMSRLGRNGKVERVLVRASLSKHQTYSTDEQSKTSDRQKSSFLKDVYKYCGKAYVGALDFGYNYSITDNTHWVSFGIVPFRYALFGMTPLDFEMSLNEVGENFIYKPTAQLYIPISRRGMFLTLYGGAAIDMNPLLLKIFSDSGMLDTTHDFSVAPLGGASFHFNYVDWWPMDIFAEYRYPVVGDGMQKGFRVGVSMSLGRGI